MLIFNKMKDKIKNFIKKSLLFFGSAFKIKNIIIFESHTDYSDNSRSFYEYLIKNDYNKKYKIYWFVDDALKFKNKKTKNVEFITMWHHGTKRTPLQWIKYFWIAKNAKYLIFSNRNLPKINKKTKTVCINHGIPIKNVKGKHTFSTDVDYRVDSSKFCAELVVDQQGFKRNCIIIVGNPRNDVLFTKTNVKEKMQIFAKFDKIILWLPTFRNSAELKRSDSSFKFPLGLPIIYDQKSLKDINSYLKTRNIGLVLKLHPAQDLSVFKANSLSNIIIIDDQYLINHDTELTELYKITDALITDYSSVYVDYLLTDKPIGFTQDDFKQYTLGFSVPNINDYMPGEKIINLNDLKTFIDHIDKNIDNYKAERKKINKLFNEFNDNKSSERLAKKLKL